MNNDNLKDWLNKVDTTGADLPEIERNLSVVLAKGAANRGDWQPTPIAPLAEPTDLDAMTGDLARFYSLKIRTAAEHTDKLFENLVELNNVLAAEMESANKALSAASDDVQIVTTLTQDQASQYVWVAESFNNNLNLDPTRTTALIDTDYGQVSLPPQEFANVQDYSVDIPSSSIQGIPGCNLLVLDLTSPGSADKGPEPTLEDADTTNISSMFDNNNQTWFEMERNFIPKMQPLRRAGRSLVYELGGKTENVIEETKDYDWRATIVLPDGSTKTGADGKGELIAEFIEDTDPSGLEKNDTQVTIKLTLTTPQPLSEIRINPYLRPGQGDLIIEQIDVVAQGQTIVVAKNKKANIETTSIRTLEKEVLRRTGSQTVGAMFEVPTDRDISQIIVRLRGKTAPVKGLAHPFAEEEVETKTTRRFLFIPSKSTKTEWNRKPISQSGKVIGGNTSTSNILGALSPILQSIMTGSSSTLSSIGSVGNLISSIASSPKSLNLGSKDVAGLGKIMGGLGKVGSIISSVVPVVGAVLSIGELANAAFGTTKSSQVIGQASGYDIFKGYRSCISIRDIGLLRVVYSSSAEVVTKKLIFPRRVTKVGLIADHTVPSDWGQGEWIRYFLSIDGVEWKPVLPLSDTTLENSLSLDSPTDAVYVRGVLSGNAEDVHRSPKINNIVLQGLPA